MTSRALAGWREKTLDELAMLLGGGTPSRANPIYFGDFIDWVTPTDLPPIGQVGVLGHVAEGLSKIGLESSSAKEIPPGSVLFSSRASIGKIAVTDRVCATNQGFANLMPKDGVVDPWFLAYLLCHNTPAITRLAGETTYKEVSRKKLRAFRVRVPLLKEQRRIVGRIQECLERVAEVRALRVEARREGAAVFPSLLAERFQSLADEHAVATIDDVALETKYGTSRRCNRDQDGTPVLRIPNVAGGAINLDDLKFCDQLSESELPKLLLQDGDLLIVRTNGSRDLVGRCAVFHDQGRPHAYASYLIRIRPNFEKVHPQFLAFFLESTMGRDAIAERRRTSAGQYNINSKNLRTIPFPSPALDVQRELVEEMVHQRRVVNGVMAEHSGMEQQDEALRQAVLRKAFAGEL